MRGKFLSGPAGILILVLFFLPWVTVSCEGDDLGELTGYQISLGDEDVDSDEFETDPLLLIIPVTGLIALSLAIFLFIKPSSSRIVGGILLFFSMAAIIIPLLRGIQLQNEFNDAFYEIILRPALWGTMVGLLGVFTGGLIDLVRVPAAKIPRRRRRGKKQDLIDVWQTTPDEGGSPTMIDADLFNSPGGTPQTGQETMIDDDVFASGSTPAYSGQARVTNKGPGYGNETILDDDLFSSGQGAGRGNETILDDDMFEQRPARPFAQSTTPYQEPLDAVPPYQKTEVLPPQPSFLAVIIILNGPRQNEQIQLAPITRIGRVPGNEIVIDDTAVSTHHATIRLRNDQYSIVDENSTNGLYVFIEHDNRWERVQETPLLDGTRVKLGRIILQMSIQRIN